MVGRLIPVKCVDDVVKAYRQLETDKKLVIAGDSSFTDEYAAGVKALAEGDDNILFVGHQTPEQLAVLYSNAYLFINASSVEGLSIAVLEAMSYGCATLVSDIDGNLEAVGDGGLTYPQGNVEALREKISGLLQDSSLVEMNGQYSRQRIAKHFDWRDVVRDTVTVYQSGSPG
jgi:glycosyltransferase involved in cell wall biosynthesis